jgi:chromosome segregation ATPase
MESSYRSDLSSAVEARIQARRSEEARREAEIRADAAEKRSNTLLEQLNDVTDHLNEVQSRREAEARTNQELSDTVVRYEKLAEVRKAAQTSVEGDVATLNEECGILTNRCLAQRRDLEAAIDEAAELGQKLTTAQQQLAELRDQNANQTARFQRLSALHSDKERENADQAQQLAALHSDLNTEKAAHEQKSRDLRSAWDSHTTMEELRKKERDVLTKEIHSTKVKHAELLDAHNSVKSERDLSVEQHQDTAAALENEKAVSA